MSKHTYDKKMEARIANKTKKKANKAKASAGRNKGKSKN